MGKEQRTSGIGQRSALDVRASKSPDSDTAREAHPSLHKAPPSRGSVPDARRPVAENIPQNTASKVPRPYVAPPKAPLSPYQIATQKFPKANPDAWRMTPNEVAFVSFYIGESRFNAADAYRRAFNVEDGRASFQLISKAKIQKAIQAHMDRRAERLELTPDKVLQEIMKIAFIDPGDLFDPITGEMRKINDIPEDARRAIAAMDIEHTKFGLKKSMKLNDKLKALELLGRHMKMFKEQLQVTVTFEQMVMASMDEVKELGAASEIVEVLPNETEPMGIPQEITEDLEVTEAEVE
jgi:phage terminase small subunit